MHHSRLCALLIDCRTTDLDEAARFWGEALGRPVDLSHPSSRGNYRMLMTPTDEPIVEIQRVDHESRVHIDIESDDIAAEVARLRMLGATVVDGVAVGIWVSAYTPLVQALSRAAISTAATAAAGRRRAITGTPRSAGPCPGA